MHLQPVEPPPAEDQPYLEPERAAFGEARALVVALLAYAAGALAWMLPVLRGPSRLLHGGGDAFNYAWRISWFAGGYRDWGGDPFFAPQVFAPLGHYLADAELTPLQMLPAALLSRAIGPVAAFDLVVAAAVVAAGIAAYALARVLRVAPLPALAAGAVFAFSPYVAAHSLGHLPLMGMWTLPATLAALESAARAWEDGRGRAAAVWGAATGAFLGLAGWSSWYYLVMFGTAALLFAGVRARRSVSAGAARLAGLALPAALAVLVAAALVAPLLWVVSTRSSGVGKEWSITKIKGAPPHAYVVPPAGSAWFGGRTAPLFTRNPTEDALFLGWIPLGLAGYAWYARRRGRGAQGTAGPPGASARGGGRRALAVTAVACAVLSLGPFLYLGHRIPPTLPVEPPAWLVARYPAAAEAGGIPIPMPALPLAFLPGFNGMREFTRFGLVVALGVGVAAAAGLEALLARIRARRALAAVLVATAVLGVFVEFLPRSVVSDVSPRPVDVFLERQPEGGSVVWLPQAAAVADEEMWRTTITGKPIAFGDATFLPEEYRTDTLALDAFPAPGALAILEERDVEWVVWRGAAAGRAAPDAPGWELIGRLGDLDVLERR